MKPTFRQPSGHFSFTIPDARFCKSTINGDWFEDTELVPEVVDGGGVDVVAALEAPEQGGEGGRLQGGEERSGHGSLLCFAFAFACFSRTEDSGRGWL